jgi:hypothetical protein
VIHLTRRLRGFLREVPFHKVAAAVLEHDAGLPMTGDYRTAMRGACTKVAQVVIERQAVEKGLAAYARLGGGQ